MTSIPVAPGEAVEPVAWLCEQQHPTRPEVSRFFTESRPTADDYRRIGWSVTALFPPESASSIQSLREDAERLREALRQAENYLAARVTGTEGHGETVVLPAIRRALKGQP